MQAFGTPANEEKFNAGGKAMQFGEWLTNGVGEIPTLFD
jgi:hypothetical protein